MVAQAAFPPRETGTDREAVVGMIDLFKEAVRAIWFRFFRNFKF